MKINKLRLFDVDTKTEGIHEINVSKLGSVVALVGRNGSGKSRILKLLENNYWQNLSCGNVLDGSISLNDDSIQNDYDSIFNDHRVTKLYKERYDLDIANKELISNPNDKIIKETILYLSNKIVRNKDLRGLRVIDSNFDKINILSEKIKELFKKRIRKIKYEEIKYLQFKIDESAKSGPLTFENLIESVSKTDDYNEFTSINTTALNYLNKLPHQLVIDRDEAYGDLAKYEQKSSFKRYNLLKKLIKDFLDKDLEWEKEKTSHSLTTEGVTTHSKGIWKLGGRIFNYNDLSDGEKTLFTYSLLFFLLELNPQIAIKESIIIIDEPELHLHPESELMLINGIRNLIKEKGQLWIATHSLSILSSLAQEEIFMVKDSVLYSPDKSIPGKTLVELMGIDEHIERLNTFLSDISTWAFVNFMEQCFIEPDVVMNAQNNDPEIEVFFKFLKNTPNPSVLLDFGAGKGRIYSELNSNKNLNINYQALETNSQNREVLNKIFPNKIYSDYKELSESSFDFVLLCNVLHEIPVIKWNSILSKIKKSLKPNGYIVIIEDLKLPRGEKIERDGFLILDKDSLEIIFNVKKSLKSINPTEEKYKERILCVPIEVNNIGEISNESIKNGLLKLQENTFNSLKKLREQNHEPSLNLSIGRLSAFYSQLHINTKFAIDTLSKEDQ